VTAREVNFDAIVGPTHNYAGLSYGNVASLKNKAGVSSPREAALEGLAKMKFMADLGVPQGVLPPPLRPDVPTLRALGYEGSDSAVLAAAARDDLTLLAAVSSASAMWAANAATVSPSADTADGRLHVSTANLLSQVHRSIEPRTTAAVLRAIFPGEDRFAHHAPLPCQARWADEGGANHMHLCRELGTPGVEVFVYGRDVSRPESPGPVKFPARQTFDACRAIARRHRLAPERTVFLQQHPAAIDAGVFHNDVAAVGHRDVLLCHAQAYLDQTVGLAEVRARFRQGTGTPLHVIEVPEAELTLAEAVETYLFNSQIVTLGDGTIGLIAPGECEHHPRARAVIDRILAEENPIRSAKFVSVRQSMRNGGGPACLRLRVVLTDAELAATHVGALLTDTLYGRLVAWVNRHYRPELRAADLGDAKLLQEARAAQEELGQILDLALV
jgi:succinylarginine dihydrolase